MHSHAMVQRRVKAENFPSKIEGETKNEKESKKEDN